MFWRKKAEAAVIISLMIASWVLIWGSCLGLDNASLVNSSESIAAQDLFLDGMNAYEGQNFKAASGLFSEAYAIFSTAGDTKSALEARNWRLRSEWMVIQFPYNRTSAEEVLVAAFPDIPEGRRLSWLEEGASQQLVSDGEVLYFEEIVNNVNFHNVDLIREATMENGRTFIYDGVKHIVFQDDSGLAGPYLNSTAFEGTGTLSVPRDLLPETGLLRLWMPLPVKTDCQVNLTVLSVEPAGYVKKGPDINGDMGIVYLEIPLEELEDDLNASVRFRFTEYEQRFAVNPDLVGDYDVDGDLYQKYTKSQGNIVVTPEITDKARAIVGDETNPYLQAKKIYDYITGSLPYSLVPHTYLITARVPESLYVHETGFGDCGAQSMYFCALCRSIGIPARAVGGMQLIPGDEGNHFWAEFYLPGYGWIPVDVTVAEASEWSFDASEADRFRFKEFYFGNLDPYRFVIQKDVDIPLDPDPGDAVIMRTVRQYPALVCDSCWDNMDRIAAEHWNFKFIRLGMSD